MDYLVTKKEAKQRRRKKRKADSVVVIEKGMINRAVAVGLSTALSVGILGGTIATTIFHRAFSDENGVFIRMVNVGDLLSSAHGIFQDEKEKSFDFQVDVAESISYEKEMEERINEKEKEMQLASAEDIDATLIRCTGYIDVGYTRSGEWTRDGVVAGKYEWLGRECNLYRQNEDGSIGEFIGRFEFLDTGYGIEGSLVKGTSIDVWHPSEDSLWDWVDEYGDYVYMELV